MTDLINVPKPEWERLQERARKLAQEKSYLQLVNSLMNQLSEVPGLARTVEAMLRLIVDHLGGGNVALYYPVASRIHYADVLGVRKALESVETVEDPMVRGVFERREFAEELGDFADTKMLTPAFTKSSSWALPLLVGGKLVGVLKTEGMLMAATEIRTELQPFFNYAALVLNNEVQSYLEHMGAAQLAAIVQSSDDAIIGKTLAGVITHWNRGAERIYGYAEAEVVGRSVSLLVPPGQEDELPRILARLQQGHPVEHFETVRRRKDGRDIQVSLTISPIEDAAGRLVGASTIARDITERRKAEEALTRRTRQLEVLARASQQINAVLEIPVVLRSLVSLALELTGATSGAPGLMSGGKMVFTEYNNHGNLLPIDYTFESGIGVPGWIIATRKPYVSNDAEHDEHVVPEIQKALGFYNLADVPILNRTGELVGCFEIHNTAGRRPFDPSDLEILQGLAASAAVALENALMLAERKRAQEELRRMNRALRMLSDSNQALIRTTDETTLLNEICQTVVDVGGYRMAWVGFAEHDVQKSVRKAAQAGHEEGYIKAMEITWADETRGRGPIGTAIRTGQPFIARDIPRNPACAPWREAARERGYQSSIALPLASDGQTFGALGIYATETDAFDAQEMEVLKELAGDLAFGIVSRRTRLAHQAAEQRMKLLDFALNHVVQAAMLTDEEGRFHYINDQACRILGYRRDELLALGVTDIDPDFPVARWAEHWRELKAKGTLLFEGRHRTKDGHVFPVEIAANYFEYDGRAYNLGLVRDITERKRIEQGLRETEERFAAAFHASPNLIAITLLADGTIVDVNEGYTELLGYSRDESIGKTSIELSVWANPADRATFVSNLHTFGEVTDFETTLRRKDGTVVTVLDSAKTIELQGNACVLSVAHDITERKRAEQERLAHLRLLEGLDQVNRAMQGTNDLEQMMSDVLDSALAIFDCDRAWLVHPCDPAAAAWRVPMERTRPAYPGALARDAEIPMDPEVARVLQTFLDSSGPVTFGPGSEQEVPSGVARAFGVQSQIAIALYPKVGKPYVFGLHQCSRPRVWTLEEKQLLQEIGRRLTDALTSLLAARELQASEARFRALFEHSPVPIGEEDYSAVRGLLDDLKEQGVSDLEAYLQEHPEVVRECAERVRLIDVNQAALALHEASSKEELLKGLLRTFTPESFAAFRSALAGLWKGQTQITLETVIQTLGGKRRLANMFLSVTPGCERTLSRILVSLIDITERKQTEEVLHEREEEFRALVENASDTIVRYDLAGRRKYVNPVFEQLAGQPADQLIGKTPTESYVGNLDVGTRSLEAIERVVREAAPVEIEVTWKDASGGPRCFQNRFTPELDRAGKVASVLSVARDITPLKLTEEKLRKLSRAVEQSPASIVITDTTGRIEYVNPKFSAVTGYSLDEALGQNPRILKSGEMAPEHYQRMWQTIAAGKEWRGELHNRKKNGELYWETASISPIFDATGAITHYLAVKEDITEHKRLEEELRQAQKMQAFGQLAGGVAHDFNNLLTVIQGNVTLAQVREPGSSEPVAPLDEIAHAAEKAANLTRQLLLFSRRQAAQLKNLDLNEVVESMTKMLRRLIGEHISLVAHYTPGGATVHADPGMLEQVLMNLAVNSRDAMPNGGRLGIRTEAVVLAEDMSGANPKAHPGSFVRLSVSDTGSGIAPEHLPRIFEPFFTTKGVGKGTGLGLATVFGIVEQHRGWIDVESQVGVGTAFHIYLPCVAAVAEAATVQRAKAAGPRGTETILLVEDEPAVRALARQVLARHGYRILEAASGPEALRLWAEHNASIDLLLTDMVMPEGMSGRALADRLQADRPSLKVIFSSGYTDEMLEEGSTLRDMPNFLSKPFGVTDLLQKVRACLDAR